MRRIIIIHGPRGSGKTELTNLITDKQRVARYNDLSCLFRLSELVTFDWLIVDGDLAKMELVEGALLDLIKNKELVVPFKGRPSRRIRFYMKVLLVSNELPEMSARLREYVTIIRTIV